MTAPDQRAVAAAAAASASAAAETAAAALFGAGSAAAVAQSAGSVVNAAAAATTNAVVAATSMIERLWHATDPYDDGSVQQFVERAARTVVAAQRSVAQTTSAAQAILVRAAGLPAPGAVRIPDDVRGAHVTLGGSEPTVHPERTATVVYQPDTAQRKTVRAKVTVAEGRPDRIFNRAVVTYRYEQSQGADPAKASRATVTRIGDIVDANLMLAQRLAEQQTLKQAGATLYRRVIHPELSKGGVCGLCVAASDRKYHIEELKPIHLRCKCGVVPVAEGSDVGYELNKHDFSTLYTEAGKLHGIDYASEGAHLKRTRYDIVHHAELGPVLTRVRGEKVPYYTTMPPAVLVAA